MFLRFDFIKEARTLAGKRRTTSLVANVTADLWRDFMSTRQQIGKQRGAVLYSLQVYPKNYFVSIDPATPFEKWALVEVEEANHLPAGVEQFILPKGEYAVFLHRGAASTGAKTFNYIFSEWMPSSAYAVDDRPHFELLGEKYKNNHPDSEEEIWIPIKRKE